MITLYQESGASDFTISQDSLTSEQTRTLFRTASRVLQARAMSRAVELLKSVPFQVADAINHFNDEFSVLYAVVPLEQYEELRRSSATDKQSYRNIAEVTAEIGPYIRFIAVELSLEAPGDPTARSDSALKGSEINKLVSRYIGVSGGYLADLTYRSHHNFYMDLDLDIDPNEYDGTTRQKFIKILSESAPDIQARILEGILEKYPVDCSDLRTRQRYEEIRGWINRLRGVAPVEAPSLRITSEVVERALRDAQELIVSSGATSGVDRVHTAMHGYLRAVCEQKGIQYRSDATLTELFKSIREKHPAFSDLGPRPDEIQRIVRAFSTILDTLNPLRNRASVAHPNPVLLLEPEAMLVINSVRTVLHYLDQKAHQHVISQKVGISSD